MDYDKSHGSPYDRGSSDYYYRSRFNPHYYKVVDGMFSERIEEEAMTPEEIAAYIAGYEEETDRKEW